MPISRKQAVIFSMSAALALLAASCGESKVSQCNKLSKVVNQAATEAKAVSSSKNPNKLAELSKAADSLDNYAKELQAIELKDQQLQSFQTRFVKMYQDTSKASRDLVTALNKRDIKAGNTALQSLQTATNQESPLVDEVNKYCTGS